MNPYLDFWYESNAYLIAEFDRKILFVVSILNQNIKLVALKLVNSE